VVFARGLVQIIDPLFRTYQIVGTADHDQSFFRYPNDVMPIMRHL
jgi:hypothetical protein